MTTAEAFVEVADRVWVARHAYLDVTVTAVGGQRGTVLVDTHASLARGREVRERVRRLSTGRILAVAHTHAHFDHVLGTAAFREADPDLPVFAHEGAAAELTAHLDAMRSDLAAGGGPGLPLRDEIEATPVVPPNRVFSSVATVDLGDRLLEVAHLGRGHTGGDAVVRGADADVVVAGDLVEQSGPPGYGPDCHPLDWPLTLDLLLGLLAERTLVVPGHGSTVDRDFVAAQREDIGAVAETVRELAASGVPVGDALARGSWPYPTSHLHHAIRCGYADLPPGGRVLPLA